MIFFFLLLSNQKYLKILNLNYRNLNKSMVNRNSLTTASNTSRQPSAFPRNVPSRSTFHSGEYSIQIERKIMKIIPKLSRPVKVKLELETAAPQATTAPTRLSPTRAEVFSKGYRIDSVSGKRATFVP